MKSDEYFMNIALSLAKKGRFTTDPNPNVGCVIVKNNIIIGKGFHFKAGEDHAEISALKMASYNAKDSTVYVNLEPCVHYGKTPPCVDALIQANIYRIVVAIKDPNPKIKGYGLHKLSEAGIKITYGILKKKAEEINKTFFKRMRQGIPYIRLKLAVSIDGFIATKNGESKWITSKYSRQDVQNFRAQSSAILTTSSTILSDNPFLNVRWNDFSEKLKKEYLKNNIRQPIRIILDRKNKVKPEHNITKLDGDCLLFTSTIFKNENWLGNVKKILVPDYIYKKNLVKLIKGLSFYEINSVFIESGSIFAGSLLKYNLVDELIIYVAPKLLGDGIKMVKMKGFNKIKNAIKFKFSSIKLIKQDLRMILKFK